MILQPGRRPREVRRDARTLLLDCHERIRKFTSIALRLADEVDAPADQIREAVQAVHRYFTVALPLHQADEDLTLRPRLVELPDAEKIVDQLAAMSLEHVELDALIDEELVPRWSILLQDPADRATRAATRVYAQRLSELIWRHLEREECHIFPGIDRLAPAVRSTIAAEIRARRNGGQP